MVKITRDQFEAIADAAVKAVGWVEGWCDEHPSWRLLNNNGVTASRAFRAELRKQLNAMGIRVLARPKR